MAHVSAPKIVYWQIAAPSEITSCMIYIVYLLQCEMLKPWPVTVVDRSEKIVHTPDITVIRMDRSHVQVRGREAELLEIL